MMKHLCSTKHTAEFATPNGGTLVYGPCEKHGYFTAIIHCPPEDVAILAQALLEAAVNTGTKPTEEADK